jgi:hypothetical protein
VIIQLNSVVVGEARTYTGCLKSILVSQCEGVNTNTNTSLNLFQNAFLKVLGTEKLVIFFLDRWVLKILSGLSTDAGKFLDFHSRANDLASVHNWEVHLQ